MSTSSAPDTSTNNSNNPTVSVNLTYYQIQFLTQHLQIELTYLRERIDETIAARKPTPVKLMARSDKITAILTNLGA